MRNSRFRALVSDLLTEHPGVSSVEPVDLGNRGRVLRVTCADGVVTDLMVTNMAPPGGDNYQEDERIVSKRATAR